MSVCFFAIPGFAIISRDITSAAVNKVSSVFADREGHNIKDHYGPDFQHRSKRIAPETRYQNGADYRVGYGDKQRSQKAVAARGTLENGQPNQNIRSRPRYYGQRGH